MQEAQVAGALSMRWVPVVDERGRTHLEARWARPVEAHAPAAVTSQAA